MRGQRSMSKYNDCVEVFALSWIMMIITKSAVELRQSFT